MATGQIILLVVSPGPARLLTDRSESIQPIRGLFEESEMNLQNLLTLQALTVALVARQAQRDLEAAVFMAEIDLLEQAQKNRPTREDRQPCYIKPVQNGYRIPC